MPHHATVLNDILNIPTPSSVINPCEDGKRSHPLEPRGDTLSPRAFDRIVASMRDRIDEPLTEDMLCAMGPMGKHAFRRAFEAHTGMLPMAYLTWMRVDMAVRLLIDTQFDLDQIAFVTGLRDTKTLTHACLQTLRVRPQALRVSVAL